MRHLLLIWSVLFLACGAESGEQSGHDAFLVGQQLIESSLNDGPESLSARIASDLKLDTFPVQHPEGSKWDRAQIELIQSIDESIIFHVGLYQGETARSATFWIENVDKRWVISGWIPRLRRAIQPQDTHLSWPTPKPFSGSALRGIPDVKTLKVPHGRKTQKMNQKPGVTPKVRSRIVQAGESCNSDRIQRRISSTHQRFASCYASVFNAGKQPRGRLSFSIRSGKTPTDIALEETTIIQSELSECLENVLSSLNLRDAEQCEFVLRILFAPKGK